MATQQIQTVDRSRDKGHPGDCNDIARQRADHRSSPPSPEYCENYNGINWKSRGDA
ncbi:MAG: hypothetical protein IH957_10830 [Chloroflexi bacterium]|nr:hypothetical protein [Chloroflexota bacterium]